MTKYLKRFYNVETYELKIAKGIKIRKNKDM